MTSAPDAPADLQGAALVCAPGEVYGGYEVLSFVKSGGTCQVFAARHQVMHRMAAIKVQKAHLRASSGRARRMLDEARALALIEHPNVVRIHHADVDERVGFFLVIEMLAGRDLRSVLTGMKAARRKVPLEEAVDIITQLADGMGAFHRAGVIHRDLKPENVFVTADPEGKRRMKLLDLGIAKLPSSKTTEEGVMQGTVSYMASELLLAMGRPSPQSDVFSLGVILDEMLSGEHPFAPTGAGIVNSMSALKRICDGDYTPLNARGFDVSPPLARFVARAVARRPEDRPASMEVFSRELRRMLTEVDAPVVRPSATTKMAVSMPDPDRTTPLGFRAPSLSASSETAALAPIDSELDSPAFVARSLASAARANLEAMPSFACEPSAALMMPSFVLVEAPGAWRFMRVPLRATGGEHGPPLVRLGEGSDIPIPRLGALEVRLLSATTVEVVPSGAGYGSTLRPYDTFGSGGYRFQFVPPTPERLGIPIDYATRTVAEHAVLEVPSLLVRAGALDAVGRRFPLRGGATLIGGRPEVDVPLFGCGIPVAARISVDAARGGVRVVRNERADVRVRGGGSTAGELEAGDVLLVEGWELELCSPERRS